MCVILVQSINVSTCLKIMQALVIFHDKPAYRKVYDLADTYWLENTLLCSQNESYLEQPWRVVSHLLSREDYIVEEIVFTAAINWFKYNPVCRAKHVEEFLTDVVRLPQLTPVFLTDVVACHPLLKAWDVTKLKLLVYEALVFHTTASQERLIASGEIRYVKRKGREVVGMVQYMYIHGGVTKARFVLMDSPLEMTLYDESHRRPWILSVEWKGVCLWRY